MNKISLYPPETGPHSVTFRWLVEPATPLYQTTTFTLRFPPSVSLEHVPYKVWWTIAFLCLHPHWALLRPCRIHLPIRLDPEEREFWLRLIDTVVDTLEAYRGTKELNRSVEFVESGLPVDQPTPLAESAATATAFSGGKDSLLQAGLLRELKGGPLLVTTTSPMPPLADHVSSRRRYVMATIGARKDMSMVQVESDFRSIWRNDFAVGLGYTVSINELTDTYLYFSSLLAVAFARGISHLFLASEAEVQETIEVDGRVIQHPHFMYSVASQRAIEHFLRRWGIRYSSLTSPLRSAQVQALLWERYPDLAHLQYSCWKVKGDQATCSACGQCLRIGLQCVAEGHDPRKMGIDLESLLTNLRDWHPHEASDRIPRMPNEIVSIRFREQVVSNLRSISTSQMERAIRGRRFYRSLTPGVRRAMNAFTKLKSRIATIQIDEAPGFRPGYLRFVDPHVRQGLTSIYESRFPADDLAKYSDLAERTERLSSWIAEPLISGFEPKKIELEFHPMKEKARLTDEEMRRIAHLIPGPEPTLELPRDEESPGRILPVSGTLLNGNEGKYLAQCVEENWISSAGRFVRMFEKEFAAAAGCEFGVACSSGTTALHLILETLGLRQDDEVIIPTFTMIATANAVAYTGATPILVDAEPATWNMNVAEVEASITERTKAIIVVHTYGHPAEMDSLRDIARRHHIALIEDAAEAHGATYKGRVVGGIGDAAAFSFYGNKIISTGEGGMVTTNDARIAHLARRLRDHAFSDDRHFWHEYVGFNYRMTNLQAAVGLAQTERLEELVAARRRNARLYEERLADIAGLTLPSALPEVESVFWMYSILVEDQFGCSRDELRQELARRGIETRTLFVPIHLQPIYYRQYRGLSFPVSEELCRKGLYLPSGPSLSESEIDFVCREIAIAGKGRMSRAVSAR